jgi:hypothetical protein
LKRTVTNSAGVEFVASKWYEEELQKHGYIEEVEEPSELEEDLQAVKIESTLIPKLWSKSVMDAYKSNLAMGLYKLKQTT